MFRGGGGAVRAAAAVILAGACASVAPAAEAGCLATRAAGADPAAVDEVELRASAVFELLVKAPHDPERAMSLVEEQDPRAEEGDIGWPFARAFALARAGESVRAAAELEKLARRLRGDVGLEVRRLRFVTRVTTFGSYEEDRRLLYRPGERLMAYAEVAGFSCEPVPDLEPGRTRWHTRLDVGFTLENVLTGERVASWGPDRVEHTTRSEIHDLHVTRVIELPGDLAPGEYELKVEIADPLAEDASGAGVRRLKAAGR